MRSWKDLRFVGLGSPQGFDSEFIKRYDLSPGRLAILKQILANWTANSIAEATDELIEIGIGSVLERPKAFGLNDQDLVGLASNASTRGLPGDGTRPVEPFLSRLWSGIDQPSKNLRTIYGLSKNGALMLRELSANYQI